MLNDISYNILNGWGTAAGIFNLAGELRLSLFWFVEVICRWITFHIFLYFLIYLFLLIAISHGLFFFMWGFGMLWKFGIFCFKFSEFFGEKNQILGEKRQILYMVHIGSQKNIGLLKIFLSYFVNGQNWLTKLMDDHHCGSIKKLNKRHWLAIN